MRILLSDGSGLTSRQTARLLARAGHDVGVLAPEPLALARMTNAVRRWHRVPVYGDQPRAWAEATMRVLDNEHYDVLLPTQEQVAVLALCSDELTARGVATAVPTFAALRRVQDKLSAEELLVELGLPRPSSFVARTPQELTRALSLPAYLKAPIGTASSGVRHVRNRAELAAAAATFDAQSAFELGGVLVQQPVSGPLIMVQAIFERGRLLALHANRRDRAGVGGGASHKTSVPTDALRSCVELIGTRLNWHGALSFDVIDTPPAPIIIDINPRLVEPGNAAAAGLDLVSVLLEVATGQPHPARQASRPGVRTHQLLLGLLAAAKDGGRAAITRELHAALTHRGDYRASNEELTPLGGDPIAAASLAAMVIALTTAPGLHSRLMGGSVASYALTPAGWLGLLAEAR